MTANRIQVGVLAMGLLVVLVVIGCAGGDDVISSGNYVVTYPTGTADATGVSYDCIRMTYARITVKPIDGTCSESSGSEFAGQPCGTDGDCSTLTATCSETTGLGCVGGTNNGVICESDTDCPGGSCLPRGQCASFPGGVFTGTRCFSDLDCTPESSEKCAGMCSAGSSNPNGACISAGDCILGECEGANAADTIGGNPILLIAPIELTAAYFTPTCSTCDLNLNNPALCNPANPVECTNSCLPADQVAPLQCLSTKCCQQSVLVAIPCQTDADCQTNECVESATSIPSSFLPEGKYEITFLELRDLLMTPTSGPRALTSCTAGGNYSDQYDPPLRFEMGAGQTNEIRFVINLAQLESLLGSEPAADCQSAFSNISSWFTLANAVD